MHTLNNVRYKKTTLEMRTRSEKVKLTKALEVTRDFAQSLRLMAKEAVADRVHLASLCDYIKDISDSASRRVTMLRQSIRERSYVRHELILGDRRYAGLTVAHDTPDLRINPQVRLELLNQLKSKLRTRRKALRTPYVNSKSYGMRGQLKLALVGGTFTAPGSILTLLKKKKVDRLYTPKKPRLNAAESYIGVEVECFIPNAVTNDRLGEVFLDNKLEDCVEVKSDGSIRPYSGHKGIELTVLAKQDDVSDVLQRVCIALATLEARVNKSCGLHVHIDMRHRDASLSGDRLVRAQALLYKLVPQSRRNNTYCKRTKRRTDMRVEGYMDIGRYHAINFVSLERHKTIEVRLHSGTTDFSKIHSWVQLLLAIADTDFSKSPRTIAGWVKALGLNASMKRYLVSREAKFKDATDADESADPRLGEAEEVWHCESDICDFTTSDRDDLYHHEGNLLCNDCFCSHEADDEDAA